MPSVGWAKVTEDVYGIHTSMSLAPNRDVPPDVSPYVMLPILTRCGHCPAVLTWIEPWAAVGPDGRLHRPLCPDCAARITA